MSLIWMTPYETLKHIAKRARAKRLSFNLSQKTLAAKSGVSFGVLKKFERTGKISLESLLKLALVLESLEGFKDLFKPKAPEEYLSLEALLREKQPKRGRL